MFRATLVIGLQLALCASLATADAAKLTAQQVVDKNVAARGGLKAWRDVQAITFEGKIAAGGNQRSATPVVKKGPHGEPVALPQRPSEEALLPMRLELKRPRKSRMELLFNGKTAVQVYDGSNGWKLRPYLNRMDVESFSADELKTASLAPELDGPLVDYVAKGSKIEMEGSERIEGRDTYKLKVTAKSGQATHVWIDAGSFLETKIEGQPRRLDGVMHPVEVYFRDYRLVSGLQIPFLLETRVVPVAHTSKGIPDSSFPPEKIVIEKVMVNPPVDDARFTRPTPDAALARK